MILRRVATRQGRSAVATSTRVAWTRPLSTTTPTPTTAADPAQGAATAADAALASNAFPPTPGSGFDPLEKHHERTFIRTRTATLGSQIRSKYQPNKFAQRPPAPPDVTLELLMASQAHMGHVTSRWNPANQRYIYGVREGIHIISLEQTAAHLRRAAKVVEGVAYHAGLILFVGTRPGQEQAVVRAAQLARGCHLYERWLPGSITNGNQLLTGCKMKVVDEFDRDVSGYGEVLEKHAVLKPDLVVCLNPLENYVCLRECAAHNIPTIGIIDTDADPTWVTYPIPANDDSLRAVQVIAGVLGRAGEAGQRQRMAAAARGIVTWKRASTLAQPEPRKVVDETEPDGAIVVPGGGAELRGEMPSIGFGG